MRPDPTLFLEGTSDRLPISVRQGAARSRSDSSHRPPSRRRRPPPAGESRRACERSARHLRCSGSNAPT